MNAETAQIQSSTAWYEAWWNKVPHTQINVNFNGSLWIGSLRWYW
jgi:hypothetical protein